MSLLQMGSKEKWEVTGVQGVVRHCVVRHRVGWGDFVMCRPRFWRVLWTGVVFWCVPSMFWVGFVDGGGVLVWAVHVRSVSWLAGLGCFVVGNFLCMRDLLNVLAAKGEQGEVGSDWYTGSCAPLCCALPCWLGRFCDVPSMFWVVFVDGGGVLGWAVHVRSVSWVAGHGCFVVSNSLCVRELLNVLAANGEQGEVESDWYTGSCASPCWLGRFCDVSSTFLVGFVDGSSVSGCAVHILGVFCGRGSVLGCAVHVLDGFWTGLGRVLGGVWGVFGGGAILKNRGVGFVGDCCYLCMIYILSVVCLGVRGA